MGCLHSMFQPETPTNPIVAFFADTAKNMDGSLIVKMCLSVYLGDSAHSFQAILEDSFCMEDKIEL